ncbi:hypothetical protein VTK73DRAFT_9240 [Phialemonium thermophilum]|uniref:Uncharacterized protein n=1 Tax=Phialemonium thermophilum TaxID=223376 RepID=A0ABR3W3L7_9PEZI
MQGLSGGPSPMTAPAAGPYTFVDSSLTAATAAATTSIPAGTLRAVRKRRSLSHNRRASASAAAASSSTTLMMGGADASSPERRGRGGHRRHPSDPFGPDSAAATTLREKLVGGGSPQRRRRTSSSSPAKKQTTMTPQFVNFTPEDHDVLMTGVAPSGSSKTKARREREAAEKEQQMKEILMKAVAASGGDVTRWLCRWCFVFLTSLFPLAGWVFFYFVVMVFLIFFPFCFAVLNFISRPSLRRCLQCVLQGRLCLTDFSFSLVTHLCS